MTDQYAHFLTGDAPTPEQVSGLWRVDDGTVTMLFSSNGSVQLDDSGEVVSDPKLIGSYSIDGQLITSTGTTILRAAAGPSRCGPRSRSPV